MSYLALMHFAIRWVIPVLAVLPFEMDRRALVAFIRVLAWYENYWLNVYVRKLYDGMGFLQVMHRCRRNFLSPDTVPAQLENFYRSDFVPGSTGLSAS